MIDVVTLADRHEATTFVAVEIDAHDINGRAHDCGADRKASVVLERLAERAQLVGVVVRIDDHAVDQLVDLVRRGHYSQWRSPDLIGARVL